jgi:hypothetical protein
VQSKFRLDRWRGRRVRLRFLATSLEVGDALTAQQAAGWNPIEADDGWYVDDVKVSNTLTSAATISVDTADRSGLPACASACTSLVPSLVITPAAEQCGGVFTLDASGSAADQCPDGALQFRFWWIWGTPPPYGDLNALNSALLQDWNENGTLVHPAQTIGRIATAWTSAARPSRLRASTETVVTVDSSCPVVVYFPYTLRFDSKSVLFWGTPTPIQGIRGSLDALRANGGDFGSIPHLYFGSRSSHYDDQYTPVLRRARAGTTSWELPAAIPPPLHPILVFHRQPCRGPRGGRNPRRGHLRPPAGWLPVGVR